MLERAMIDRYLAATGGGAAFEHAYWALAAQRNTRILGVFVRLWKRDGKPQYRAFQPRMWGLLERDLAQPGLGPRGGQRAHALAEAGGHDHRRMRDFGGDLWAQAERAAGVHSASAQAAARSAGGTLASNQARTGSSPGAARSRSSRPHMRGWKLR